MHNSLEVINLFYRGRKLLCMPACVCACVHRHKVTNNCSNRHTIHCHNRHLNQKKVSEGERERRIWSMTYAQIWCQHRFIILNLLISFNINPCADYLRCLVWNRVFHLNEQFKRVDKNLSNTKSSLTCFPGWSLQEDQASKQKKND